MDANAEVAQLVEQWIENPCVGGSSPPLGTTFANSESVSFINLGLADFCFDSGFDSNWDQNGAKSYQSVFRSVLSGVLDKFTKLYPLSATADFFLQDEDSP